MLPPLPEAPAPAPRLAPEPPLPTATHTVRQGDCLWGIAAQYGLSPAELAAANALPNPSIIYAGQQLKVVGVRLYYDGKPVIADTPAIKVKGRTVAPFRAIVEKLGGTVVWDAASSRATAAARGRNIAVTIGSDQATVDTEIVAMDAPAELRRDRTMVPLRLLGDVLGLGLRYAEGAVHIASAR